MNKKVLFFVMLRAIFFAALFLYLVINWGDQFVGLFFLLYKFELLHLIPEFNIASLHIASVKNESLVWAEIATNRATVFQGVAVPTGFVLTVSTLTGHALKHLVIIPTFLLSAPLSRWRVGIKRFLLGIIAIILLEMVDVPIALAGAVRDFMAIAPATELGWNANSITLAARFLDGGGRFAISIAVALIALNFSA